MGSRSTGGSSDQRPVTCGGPVRAGSVGRVGAAPSPPSGPRRPAYRLRRGPDGVRRCAVRPPDSSARTGAKVSPVTRPDQARSHRVVARAWSSVDPTCSERVRKKCAPPPARASSTARPSAEGTRSGSGPGSVTCAESARCSETQPSSPGSDAVAAPEHLAGGHQLVEQGGGVVDDPGGQHERLDGAGRQHGTAQLLDDAHQAVAPAQPAADALPPLQEAGQLDRGDRLDLGAQRGERAAAQQAQHLGVAELGAPTTGGQQLALDDPARRHQPGQGGGGDRGAQPVGARHLGGVERHVGAGVAGDEVTERVGDRLEERLRHPGRQRDARARRAAVRRRRWPTTGPRPRPAPR